MKALNDNFKEHVLQLINIHNDLTQHNNYNDQLFETIHDILLQIEHTTFCQKRFWLDFDALQDSNFGLLEYLSMYTPGSPQLFEINYQLDRPSILQIEKSLVMAENNLFPILKMGEDDEQIVDKNQVLINLLNNGVISNKPQNIYLNA